MFNKTDIVICHLLRTPVGAFLGSLATVSATDLASTVLPALRWSRFVI